jgi:hypothetical protein
MRLFLFSQDLVKYLNYFEAIACEFDNDEYNVCVCLYNLDNLQFLFVDLVINVKKVLDNDIVT